MSVNARGFSIIEVLVALGLLGIVILGSMAMMDSTRTEIRRLQSKQNAISVVSEVQSALMSSAACQTMLGIAGAPTLDLALASHPTQGQPIVLNLRNGDRLAAGETLLNFDRLYVDRVQIVGAIDRGSAGGTDRYYSARVEAIFADAPGATPWAPRRIGEIILKVNAARTMLDCGGASGDPAAICVLLGGTFTGGNCSLSGSGGACTSGQTKREPTVSCGIFQCLGTIADGIYAGEQNYTCTNGQWVATGSCIPHTCARAHR